MRLNPLMCVVMASVLLCLQPAAVGRCVGALLLVGVLPGACLWSAAGVSCWRWRWDLGLALAVATSGAVTPLLLFWSCYGHALERNRCGATLVAACLALLGIALVRAAKTKTRGAPSSTEPTSKTHLSRSDSLALAFLTLVFAALVLTPWSSNGRRVQGVVSQSPCSGDWSCHRSVTEALLATGVPPRNPFYAQRRLTYYYGHFLQAAALVRLSGDRVSVEAALTMLSALLGAATCVLVYHLVRTEVGHVSIAGLGRWSLSPFCVATAVTLLVSGLDLVVLYCAKLLGFDQGWEWGHLQVWTAHPRVPMPYSNLHWAPHHHAAALLVLALVWLMSPQTEGSGRAKALTAAVLVGGVLVNSVYVGIVTVLGLGLLAAGRIWRRLRGHCGREGLALPAVALLLGPLLASGILLEISRMPPSYRSELPLVLPRGSELLWWAVGRLTAQEPAALHSPYFSLLDSVFGLLGVPLQFGLVGLLAALGFLQKGGPQVAGPTLAFMAAAAFCALFLGNFDLQMRSAGLLWMLLAVPVGRFLARGSWPRWRLGKRAGVAVLCAIGLAGLGFEVAGMSRPVYFDAHDMAVMSWVREHTPRSAVVQAFPDTHPRVAWMPRPRYFVRPSFPEFTGRVALLGDRFHAREYSAPAEFRQTRSALEQAFLAETPEQSRAQFVALGVQYVLWMSGDEQSQHARARDNLLDPGCFELLFRDGPAFVVRVRPIAIRRKLITPERAVG